MITPSYGVTATERVLPKLALDFTTANLDSRVTFTRTTGTSNPATYVDSNGYIVEATNNQPRFDYDSVTLACKGLLIEESKTNVYTYSNDFLNTAAAGSTRPWTWSNATAASVSQTAPDGSSSCYKVTENTANSSHFIYQSNSATNGITYCYSLFVKADGRSVVRFDPNDGTFGANINVTFDLTAETATAVGSPAGYGIVKYKNGWYRCWAAFTAIATSTGQTPLYLINGGATYQGDGTSGVLVYGAQVEVGPFPTSYIPTTTTALTRNADVATMTGTNFSDWYNQSTGTFMAQAIVPQLGRAARIFAVDSGATTNMMDCTISASNGCALESIVGGSYIGFVGSAGTISANTAFKVCTAYSDATTEAFSLNANTTGTNSLSFYTSMTTLRLGAQAGGTFINGALQKFNYYPQRLTNNEVQAFSKG